METRTARMGWPALAGLAGLLAASAWAQTSEVMRAVISNDPGRVRTLISSRADLNVTDDLGRTPMIYAAEQGYEPIVRALAEAGASLNVQDGRGRTALLAAAEQGHLPVVLTLIRERADTGLTADGKTALHHAVEKENPQIADALLAAGGADPNIKDRRSRTPLMHAAWLGNPWLTDLLTRMDADTALTDRRKRTALHYAARNGDPLVATFLIRAGANLNAKGGNNEETPLMFAARLGHLAFVNAMIDAGADLGLEDKNGNSADILAAHNGHTAIATALAIAMEEADADPDNLGGK